MEGGQVMPKLQENKKHRQQPDLTKLPQTRKAVKKWFLNFNEENW